MVSHTNEAALETHIENALAKDCYCIGNPVDFDREFALDGKLYLAVDQCKQRMVLAHADIGAGVKACPTLANNDRTCGNELTAKCLNAEPFGF